MRQLEAGRSARVQVPATSANLGCGFDCMGLALDWRDELTASVVAEGLEFELTGEGAASVPRDGKHLVVSTVRRGLEALGASAPGLRLEAHTTIPLSRGLGSSAAAIVAGLALAWGLAHPGEELDLQWLDDQSTAVEGHPDNVTAAVHGGAVLAWRGEGHVEVVELDVHPELRSAVFVPHFTLSTSKARGVLPTTVTHGDAVAQARRAALLVEALREHPRHLFEATDDLLHQRQRGALMPPSAELIAQVRSRGVAAMTSGAGPTVLALGTHEQLAALDGVEHPDHERHDLAIGAGVALV